MAMRENNQFSFYGKSRRTQHTNKIHVPMFYSTDKDGFKDMVLRLTGPQRLEGLNGIPPPPHAHVSNFYQIMSNRTCFPYLAYHYPIWNNTDAQPPSTMEPMCLPPRWPPVPVRTNTWISDTQPPSTLAPLSPPVSTAELSNAQPPSLPSEPSFLPPLSPREQEESVSSFMQYFMTEDGSNDEHFSAYHNMNLTGDGEQQPENVPPPVPANSPTGIPESFPLEGLVWSNSPKGLVPENIPFSETSPSRSLDWSSSMYDLRPEDIPLPSGSLEWSSSTYDLRSENIMPPIPSMNLPDVADYPHHLQSESIPPPAPTTSLYESWPNSHNSSLSENTPPPTAPATSPYESWPSSENTPPPTVLSSESLLGWPTPQNSQGILTPVPMMLPPWNQYWPDHLNDQPGWSNSQNDATLSSGNLDWANYLPLEEYVGQSGFGTVPSWNLD